MDEGKSLTGSNLAGSAGRGRNAKYRHNHRYPTHLFPLGPRGRGSPPHSLAPHGSPEPLCRRCEHRKSRADSRSWKLQKGTRVQAMASPGFRARSPAGSPESRAGLPTPPGSGQRPCRRYYAGAEQTRKRRRTNPECHSAAHVVGERSRVWDCGAWLGVGGVD